MKPTRGGGVLLAAHNRLNAVRVDFPNLRSVIPSIDMVWCRVKLKSTYLFVVVVYIPPTTDTSDYEVLLDILSSQNVLLDKHLIIVGDFNAPLYVEDSLDDCRSRALKMFSQMLDLKQVNHILNCNSRLLDLVFSDAHCILADDAFSLVNVDPYHPPIHFNYKAEIMRGGNFGVSNNNSP
ncbi:uncharacterized protein LOC123320876 isoform X1 [Coccinella septempunctata]|uniref:uncharacterized protein LOC123320876 isoform X1 n=1 Tax=Coccinella septempunctata TaxID=41139 RepID=UPI001D079B3E|nr:uncharacterized protein LOC123320876 isoform X1 [Coccinella septempunctata]XP_044764281.1 uncharacterized protein LOC123320876 isoform X1 [Coccinella septempunctata]